MKSLRSSRRGVPNNRQLRSRDGRNLQDFDIKSNNNLKANNGKNELDKGFLPILPMVPTTSGPNSNSINTLATLNREPSPRQSPFKGDKKTTPFVSSRLAPYLRQAFDKLDSDGSHSLSKKEFYRFAEILAEHQIELTSHDIDMLFLCFDKDSDGCIDRTEVYRKLESIEVDKTLQKTIGTHNVHTHKRRATWLKTTTIFIQPKFTPTIPPKQTPRSLAW